MGLVWATQIICLIWANFSPFQAQTQPLNSPFGPKTAPTTFIRMAFLVHSIKDGTLGLRKAWATFGMSPTHKSHP